MQQQQIVPFAGSKKDMLILGAGICIGVGCCLAYKLFTEQDKRIHELEKRVRHLEKNTKKQDDFMATIQHDQKAETKRLDQTRGWIFDEKEKRVQLIELIAQGTTDITQIQETLDNLKAQFDVHEHQLALYDRNSYFTPNNSSSSSIAETE